MSKANTTWNYRVIRRAYSGASAGETCLSIHEAHYGEDNERPLGISATQAIAQGETLGELAEVLEKMRAALAKPVLEYDDFPEVRPE